MPCACETNMISSRRFICYFLLEDDPESWSQLKLDDSFDPSSEEAQLYMMDFCDNLFEQEFAETIDHDYVCPMTQFLMWLQGQSEKGT